MYLWVIIVTKTQKNSIWLNTAKLLTIFNYKNIKKISDY